MEPLAVYRWLRFLLDLLSLRRRRSVSRFKFFFSYVSLLCALCPTGGKTIRSLIDELRLSSLDVLEDGQVILSALDEEVLDAAKRHIETNFGESVGKPAYTGDPSFDWALAL